MNRKLIMVLTFILLMNVNNKQIIFAQEKSAGNEISEIIKIGEGDTDILIIPCMSCRAMAWEDFMERNKEKYKMYAVTIPGFGGTPVPDLPQNTNHTPWRNNVLEKLSDLIKRESLTDLTVIGHSWGTMVAVQLAAIEQENITGVIAVDGKIESDTWLPKEHSVRLERANQITDTWSEKLKDAEEWRKFNTVSLPAGENVLKEDATRALKLHGSFMATSRVALMQYWRENFLIDLTESLNKIKVPVLNIQAFTGKNQLT